MTTAGHVHHGGSSLRLDIDDFPDGGAVFAAAGDITGARPGVGAGAVRDSDVVLARCLV